MDKIAQNNANYEIRIDIRKLFKTFNVGDVILLNCSTDLFQILKKLNCIYVINFDISSIFNIEDLVDYKCFDFNPNNFFIDEPSPEPIFERPSIPPISNILLNTVDRIDKILDDEIIMICKYLVRRKGSAPIDFNRLKKDEITSITDSTKSSSLQHGENDADNGTKM